MWSDKESSVDYLNFNETAESIRDLITVKELMPLSIGIFGNWGAGKSTILELTSNLLKREKEDYIQIHFDAWIFQGYDDAKAALLETIASELIKQAKNDESLVKKALDFASRIDKIRALGFLAEAGSAIAGMPTFGAIQNWFSSSYDEENTDFNLDDVKTDGKKLADLTKKGTRVVKSKRKISPPTEIRAFRKSYSELLKEFNRPVVVYVDNLDRCSPVNAISTLEAIRLFLFLPNTAFVTAADEDMIRLAVPHFHKGASQRHQTDYLDKLIQIPVHVPKPGVAEIRAYLMMLIAQDKEVGTSDFEKIRTGLENSLRMSWKEAPITIDDLLSDCEFEKLEELRNDFKSAERLAPIMAESTNINGNPRIVKRLLNQVRMRKRTALRRGMNLDEKTITKLVIFERCMGAEATDKLYELIDQHDGKPKVIADIESADKQFDVESLPKEWKDNLVFLNKWAKLDPLFANIDLTPAAYLSRQSIPIGSVDSIMSGAAQKLLNGLLLQQGLSSPINSELLEKVGVEEYQTVMDCIIVKLKQVEEWKKPPLGFYGARLLANKNDQCKNSLLAFSKTLPKQRWLTSVQKELEGTK